ncbi:MAG: LLM class flavin-dependent oxidoreductase [Actinomycetales bacterium]
MRFAVDLPIIGDFADPRLIAELAVLAEESDWDALLLWDHLVYGEEPLTDPIVALTAAAMTTERIRLGLCVAQLGRRRPAKLARELAAIDRLSGGRVILGVGLGSNDRDFAAFGDDPDPRVRGQKTDEGLEVVTGLWTGEPFSYSGAHFLVDDVTFLPRPVQRPRIPIWVGGSWPNRAPFRRAARWDAVFPIFRDVPQGQNPQPELLAEAVQFVRAEREAGAEDARSVTTGREVGTQFDVAMEGVTESPRSGPAMGDYADVGLTWWVESLGWWRGDVSAVRRRITQGPPAV